MGGSVTWFNCWAINSRLCSGWPTFTDKPPSTFRYPSCPGRVLPLPRSFTYDSSLSQRVLLPYRKLMRIGVTLHLTVLSGEHARNSGCSLPSFLVALWLFSLWKPIASIKSCIYPAGRNATKTRVKNGIISAFIFDKHICNRCNVLYSGSC